MGMTPPVCLHIADKKEVKEYKEVYLWGCDEKKVEKIEKLLSNDFDVYTAGIVALASGYRKKRPDSYDLEDIGIEIHEGFHNFLKRRVGDHRMSPRAYLFNENFAMALEDHWTKRCVRSLENEAGKKFLKRIEKRKYWSDCFRTDAYKGGKKVNNGEKVFDGMFFSLYPEASLILERYGVEGSLEIFAGTIETAYEKGFDIGLRHLLSYLPEAERKSVDVKNVLDDDFEQETYQCETCTPEYLAERIRSGIKGKIQTPE